MSTRERALALLLATLTDAENSLDRVAEQQQAAFDDIRYGYDTYGGYADRAAEHRQAAAWIEAIREEITACGLLDRLDADQEPTPDATGDDHARQAQQLLDDRGGVMIPAQRTPAHDDTDAALHAEVARRFAEQAVTAEAQSRFLLMLQTDAGNRSARFESGVARIIRQHADTARADGQMAKETAR
jgi:hypothetical protein